jgi:hypothetical protein
MGAYNLTNSNAGHDHPRTEPSREAENNRREREQTATDATACVCPNRVRRAHIASQLMSTMEMLQSALPIITTPPTATMHVTMSKCSFRLRLGGHRI